MSTDLSKYNAAKKALAEAHRIDEVKDIRDKAVAMRMYAMQARDRVLIDQATEIRLRAERRAGQLLKEMEKNKGGGERGVGRRGTKNAVAASDHIKLSDLGINKSQSSRWQKLADIDDDEFEGVVTHAQHKASAAVDHAQQPKPKPKPEQSKRKQFKPMPIVQGARDKRRAARFIDGIATLSDTCLSYTLMKELPRFSADQIETIRKEMREARKHLLNFIRKLEGQYGESEPGANSGDPIAACLAEVVPVIRTAIVEMDVERRLVFLDELRKAIRTIVTDVTTRDADTNHWTEPHIEGERQ
jgi:hypothetical protein